MTDGVIEKLSGARNVLMLAPSLSSKTDDIHDHLIAKRSLDEENLLVLTFQDPERWLARLDRHYDGLPNKVTIVAMDETTRTPAGYGDDVSVTTVKPADLTSVGMAVTDCITDWADSDAETVVCFDSVTDFLQYADRSTMYRFLRVVTRRFDAVDGFAHFHMDPYAHDRETIATLKSPFDAVVDASGEGDESVTVSTRY
ncbi:DUF7504 family protein [Halorussus salinus]|uniref:DUF7504 family protein n=1 Tax=Halorussus salinus TaxID=1364935 RepID=UPI00109297B3|nr:hypothetical protein [Halorussus salinus]